MVTSHFVVGDKFFSLLFFFPLLFGREGTKHGLWHCFMRELGAHPYENININWGWFRVDLLSSQREKHNARRGLSNRITTAVYHLSPLFHSQLGSMPGTRSGLPKTSVKKKSMRSSLIFKDEMVIARTERVGRWSALLDVLVGRRDENASLTSLMGTTLLYALWKLRLFFWKSKTFEVCIKKGNLCRHTFPRVMAKY